MWSVGCCLCQSALSKVKGVRKTNTFNVMWQLLNEPQKFGEPTPATHKRQQLQKHVVTFFGQLFLNQAKTHHNNTNNWPCNFRSNTTTLTFSPSPRIMLRFTFCTGNPLMTSTTTSRQSTGTLHVNTLVDRLGSIFVRTIAFFDSWG